MNPGATIDRCLEIGRRGAIAPVADRSPFIIEPAESRSFLFQLLLLLLLSCVVLGSRARHFAASAAGKSGPNQASDIRSNIKLRRIRATHFSKTHSINSASAFPLIGLVNAFFGCVYACFLCRCVREKSIDRSARVAKHQF